MCGCNARATSVLFGRPSAFGTNHLPRLISPLVLPRLRVTPTLVLPERTKGAEPAPLSVLELLDSSGHYIDD